MGELDALIRRQRAAATQALEVVADRIIGEAQRIAPHDEGTLADSAGRETVELPGGGVQVTMFFATPYAARQHEDDSYQHKDGRQAHYLEHPFKTHAPRAGEAVAAAVRAVT